MRVLPVLLTCLLSSVAAAADGAATVSKRVAAAPNELVRISDVAGAVTVTAWDKPEVDVQGRLGPDVERVEVNRNLGEVEVRVVMRNRMGVWRDASADLQVRVPAASALEVTTVSASITVEGGQGKVRLKSVSGGIRAQVQGVDLEAQSVSGRISLTGGGRTARVKATSVSGGVELLDVGGEVDARTTSGSLSVNADPASLVQLKTVSGSITFSGKLLRTASLEAESVSGRVAVIAAADAGYRYDVSTFSGSISNCFGVTGERSSDRGRAKRLSGVRGAAAASVRIKSFSGGISLCDSSTSAMETSGGRQPDATVPTPAGRSQGNVSKVNDSIGVESGGVIGDVETVNGNISLGAGATASQLQTVNGSVRVADGARILGSASAVNGSIRLGKQVEVQGDVSTVNGTIRIDNTHVRGKLETSNGEIDVGENSRVDGGIHVKGCRTTPGRAIRDCNGIPDRPQRVVIRAGATVSGNLKFEREVLLYVSDRATIGTVEGATPIRFAGNSPPVQ